MTQRDPATPPLATIVGFAAIVMWGLLALMSKVAGGVPAFQLMAMTFGIGGLVGLAYVALTGGSWRDFTELPLAVWLLSVGGLFGSHLLYFLAIRSAPVVEVSLIAYLWPLLIVLFSALLPGQRLRAHHVGGALLGLAGTVLVVGKGGGLEFLTNLQTGHLIALPYAMVWAAYSVSMKRFGAIPTKSVAGFCLATALLAGIAHIATEETNLALSAPQWAAVAGLGLLPVGAAFYAWDYGIKHGDPALLGALAYAAPLISTLVLLAAGFADFHWSLIAACALIVGGALWASKDLLLASRP